MTASPALAVPRAAPPRSRLGTRLALILLPLVLVPLILMGGAAYLRARQLIRQQATAELTGAVSAEFKILQAWAHTREELIAGRSQSPGIREPVATLLASPGAFASRTELIDSLRSVQASGNEVLFTDVMVVRASDQKVMAATDPELEGRIASAVQHETLPLDQVATTPVFDDPLFGPSDFAIVTSTPMRSPGGEIDAYLIGVSRGVRMTSLLNQMQGLWAERAGLREEAGKTYLTVAPDIVVTLPEYIFATEPEILTGLSHPVFSLGPEQQRGAAEYASLANLPVVGAYEWSPEQGMGVVLEVPQSEVYAGLSGLAPFSVGLIVFAAMLCFVIVLITTDRLLRPLGQLTEFADRISRGEWDHRVPETRDDEIGALASSFNRMAGDLSGLYGSLEARVEERTRQVRTAAEVARAVTSTPNLDDLLRRAVELIRDRFGYYHVTIFLLDEAGERAVVRESTGEVGQLLKARGHNLAVGSPSVIGWVTANNQGRIATDVGKDPIHLKNELLPETRSEAAVPLQVTGRVLGALDVQSKEANAFSPEALEVLQALADQLSTAIQNARLAQDSAVAAERARLLTAVTGQFGGLMDVERVLETAAHTLHRVLGQPEIIITLAPEAGGAREGGDGRG